MKLYVCTCNVSIYNTYLPGFLSYFDGEQTIAGLLGAEVILDSTHGASPV